MITPSMLRKQRAFTLIEVLVALSITVIIIGVTVARFRTTTTQQLNQELSRLALLLEAARHEAITHGLTLGWSTHEQGYIFWQRDAQQQWQKLDKHSILRPRQLPPSVHISALQLNLRNITLSQRLLFNASGINTPFTITLSLAKQHGQLCADTMGRISIIYANSDVLSHT